MSRTLTTEKKNFYKFKNKVNLNNTETFGYFSDVNPLNNELFVYLNTSLDNSLPTSITNYNIGYNINDTVKLFWDNKLDSSQINKFYDESLFGGPENQPHLTEYMEYRGNIFELYERLTQYTKNKIVREQEVKYRYLNWFDPNFLTVIGMQRISRYIFNLGSFASKNVDGKMKVNYVDLTYKFNEYFRINSSSGLDGKEMFVNANSNSIRPSRIYYKKIKTEIGINSFENKFIFPLYISNNVTLLSGITGMVVLRDVTPISVNQSVTY
jgi:hypothetical protein